jgi:hypothetical protein
MQRQFLFCALFTLAAPACSDAAETSGPTEAPASLLEPPPPGSGVQFRMVTELAAGIETERCQFFQVPAEGLHVKRSVIRYSPGSHHVLLYGTPYTEIPTTDTHGNTHDTSGVIECAEGAPADWQVTGILAAAQSPKGVSLIDLPDGVAVHLPPGQVVLVNAHYLNATNDVLDVDARINVESVPKESVREEAGVLFFYNPFIHVPPTSRASARMSCPMLRDITLLNGQSHMHRRGVGYEAVLRDGEGAPLQTLYTGDRWEDVRVETFSPALTIPAGHSIDYRCDYQNGEPRDVFQGLTTRDEMCMFVGAYYPRDRTTEMCGIPGAKQRYIGGGSASCAETLSCMDQAATPEDRQKCVVASCPGASNPITDYVTCTIGSLGSCATACANPLSAACASCSKQVCSAEVAACQASSCG